jgi:hypothetical protein
LAAGLDFAGGDLARLTFFALDLVLAFFAFVFFALVFVLAFVLAFAFALLFLVVFALAVMDFDFFLATMCAPPSTKTMAGQAA